MSKIRSRLSEVLAQADLESVRAVELSRFESTCLLLSSISMLPLKPAPSSITIRRVFTLPITEASFLIFLLLEWF